MPGASGFCESTYSCSALLLREHAKDCYPFVIRFSGFTRLSDSTCADNAEHFFFAHLVNRSQFRLPLVNRSTKRANWIRFPNPIKEDRGPIGEWLA